jgi:uncharacterized membrane protein HdeD (DUF308 family)
MMNITKNNCFTLVAIVMLFCAASISPLPYSYFQILRWVVAIVAIYNSYSFYRVKNNKWMIIMGAIAVLFNPITPIHFERETWEVLDVVAAVILFFGFLKK